MENNVKTDTEYMGCTGVDRIDLAEDRDKWQAVLNTVMNFRFP